MIYSNILNPKFRNLLRIFVLFLVAIFSLSLYSCKTTSIETYSPEQLRAEDEVKILDVKTKTDSTINLSAYETKYCQKFNESADVIVWHKSDTIIASSEIKAERKIQNNFSKMSLQDISTIKIEKEKTDNIMILYGVIIAVSSILIILSTIHFDFKIDTNGAKLKTW
jgi:hypothetical protein